MVRVIIEKLIQCPKLRSPFYIGHTGEECKVWLGTMLVVKSRFNSKGSTRSTVKLTAAGSCTPCRFLSCGETALEDYKKPEQPYLHTFLIFC